MILDLVHRMPRLTQSHVHPMMNQMRQADILCSMLHMNIDLPVRIHSHLVLAIGAWPGCFWPSAPSRPSHRRIHSHLVLAWLVLGHQ
jgi:hypothetical protein